MTIKSVVNGEGLGAVHLLHKMRLRIAEQLSSAHHVMSLIRRTKSADVLRKAALIQCHWEGRLAREIPWTQTGPTINCLFLLFKIIEGGLLRADETPPEFNERIQQAYHLYLNERDVVGRLQKGRQPGDDPGDDEDRAGGEDQRPGLRGRGEVSLS